MIKTLLAILIGILVIAASSIGIQFYNKCDSLQADAKMKRNKNFLIAMLVLAILLVLVSGVMKGLSMKTASNARKYAAMQGTY